MRISNYTNVLFITCMLLFSASNIAQAQNKKKRTDFAQTSFELGTTYYPSFTGKQSENGNVSDLNNPASFNPNLQWGGFHFWGHAEFNVSFPLGKLLLQEAEGPDANFRQSVVTGARFYPWAVAKNKVRPYAGLSWSAYDYQQSIQKQDNKIDLPMLSKNFELGMEAGLLYTGKHVGVRLNVNYFLDNDWDYPISKTQFASVQTPQYGINLGVLYAYESSANSKGAKEWNDFPRVSPLGYQADRFGDFFVGVGPSSSFSLERAQYNERQLPYLNPKVSSRLFFDMALGYQFNDWNMFTALSFRNPQFVREGFGTKQTIQKTSLALEASKFLTDYTGFAPYIGLNVAYDKIDYTETENDLTQKEVSVNQINPGVTFGWDIVPGKTSEALILRTNLRWYPRASFEVDKQKFNFSQLEYNFIQLVFYPDRYLKARRK